MLGYGYGFPSDYRNISRAVSGMVSGMNPGRAFGTVPGAADEFISVTGFERPTESRFVSSQAVLKSVASWFVCSFV